MLNPEYKLVKKTIHGQEIEVKVFPSIADKITKSRKASLREVRPSYSLITFAKMFIESNRI